MDDDEMETVNDNSEINDIRTQPEFKGITLSGYKKTEVRKQLIESLKKKKIEQACHWSAELICAGHYIEVWEIYLHFVCKYIHLGNPKIAVYLEKRYTIFKNIMAQGQFLNELQLRNHPVIRQLFAEITCTICLSEKKNSTEPVKIKRDEEFDITQMSEKLIAPNINYIEPIFLKDDPKEFYIAANEFAYNISDDKKNMLNACYWIEWTIEFENLCKKRKNKSNCEGRSFVKVDAKGRNDIIWILWDAILFYSKKKPKFVEHAIYSLFNLFCIKYTTASCKKRRYLLYFAVSLLTETVRTDVELVSDKNVVNTVIKKINSIYKQIKKNECSPNTEYLFANVEQANTFERSIKQMELVNSVDIHSRV
jgi:hypothetical protein